jgi:hypothetical protein
MENRSLHTYLCVHRQIFTKNLVSLIGNLNLLHPVLQLKMLCGISSSFKSQEASYFRFFSSETRSGCYSTEPPCVSIMQLKARTAVRLGCSTICLHTVSNRLNTEYKYDIHCNHRHVHLCSS